MARTIDPNHLLLGHLSARLPRRLRIVEDKESGNEFLELVSAIEDLDSLAEESKKLRKWSDIEKIISKIVRNQQTTFKEILEIRRTLKTRAKKR